MNTQDSVPYSITEQALQTVPGCVIPFGYACDSPMTRLVRLMQDNLACIVDIRLVPRSGWHPAFNKVALAKQFPKRYIHMPELGNLHYRLQDRKKASNLLIQSEG